MHVSDTTLPLMIFRSLSLNYPILAEIGYVPAKPLVIHVGMNQSRRAAEILAGEESPIISDVCRLKEIVEMLQGCNSEYLIFPYSATRKGEEIVKLLAGAVKMNCINGKRLRALPLIIAEERIKGNAHDFFHIYLEGDLSGIKICEEEVVPQDEHLSVVFDKITDIDMTGKLQDEKALLAAACFVYPYLKSMWDTEKFSMLLEEASRLVAYDEDNCDMNDIDKIFIDELYTWQERSGFQDVFVLPQLEMSVENKIQSVMLYDEKHLYFCEKIFLEIAQSLLSMFSLVVLKRTLLDCGILYPENTATYTVKVNYYNIVGEYKRVRMLRFKREKLCRLGELEFVELCLNEKGENGDEN